MSVAAEFLFAQRPLVAPWKEVAQYALAEEVVARAQRGSPPPPEPKRVRPGALKAPQVGGWIASPWEGADSSTRGDTLSSSARAVDERALERGRQARLKQQRDAAQQQQQALEKRRLKQQHQAVGDNALRGRGWREVPGVRGGGVGGGVGGGRGRSASPARGAVHSARSGSPAGGAAADARPPSARAAAAATRAVAAAAAARAAAAAARAATPEGIARARAAARDAAGSIWVEQVALWRGLSRWRAAAARRRRRQQAVAVADRAAPLGLYRARGARGRCARAGSHRIAPA